jgi:hypothetical protein
VSSVNGVLQAFGGRCHQIGNTSDAIGGCLVVVNLDLAWRPGNSLPPSILPQCVPPTRPSPTSSPLAPIPDRPPIGPMPYLIQCHHPHACRRVPEVVCCDGSHMARQGWRAGRCRLPSRLPSPDDDGRRLGVIVAISCLGAAAVPETLKRRRSRPAGPCRLWSSRPSCRSVGSGPSCAGTRPPGTRDAAAATSAMA